MGSFLGEGGRFFLSGLEGKQIMVVEQLGLTCLNLIRDFHNIKSFLCLPDMPEALLKLSKLRRKEQILSFQNEDKEFLEPDITLDNKYLPTTHPTAQNS